ncbi:Nuclear receptor-binding protein [Oopsacas minuta]|uniref:Nuclear receptor-binding protein n=1 Tax=Oopsacas minuta TaxID=111878 RepID=A0AAV7JTE4_9METZ|nr:Nuclear receptor-binding protein [Oopsacas minuta]
MTDNKLNMNNQDVISSVLDDTDEVTNDFDEDVTEDNAVLEISPDKRWQKHAQIVNQSDVPGIDSTHLGMDTLEGVEVVWNEVNISQGKFAKQEKEKLMSMFLSLKKIQHVNVVKLHDTWHAKDKNCLVFITEYMTSGSLRPFLERAKKNKTSNYFKTWKHWCRQILWALSYFHQCEPPIVHNNLTCDNIYIQHNGLLKIGCVDPDTIRLNVKTFNPDYSSLHYAAPEYTSTEPMSPHVGGDIYAFGICALEMIKQGLVSDQSSGIISEQQISELIDSIDNEQQREFIRRCCAEDPTKRPTSQEALLHPALFEVHPLKLFAAHKYIEYLRGDKEGSLKQVNQINHLIKNSDKVYAVVYNTDNQIKRNFKLDDIMKNINVQMDIHKYLEDIREGHYPLIYLENVLFRLKGLTLKKMVSSVDIGPDLMNNLAKQTQKTMSDEAQESDLETRRAADVTCELFINSTDVRSILIDIKFENMRRELCTHLKSGDTHDGLVIDLVENGFINTLDSELLSKAIEKSLKLTPTLQNEPLIHRP